MQEEHILMKCSACRILQSHLVDNERTWACKFCYTSQPFQKVYARKTTTRCIEKPNCLTDLEICFDGENPSTSQGIIKSVIFNMKDNNNEELGINGKTVKDEVDINGNEDFKVLDENNMNDLVERGKRKRKEDDDDYRRDFKRYGAKTVMSQVTR